jgi:hypothetical protein
VHKWLAATTRLADGEFLQLSVNREEFQKLQERTGISVISRRDGKHFKPEATDMKK